MPTSLAELVECWRTSLSASQSVLISRLGDGLRVAVRGRAVRDVPATRALGPCVHAGGRASAGAAGAVWSIEHPVGWWGVGGGGLLRPEPEPVVVKHILGQGGRRGP